MARTAERELASEQIFCFSTPSRTRAMESDFYRWMFEGERVYQSLRSTHPLLGAPHFLGKACFETFPHAITCALLRNGVASAKHKRIERRQVLESAGINTAALRSIDALDAALCALTARFLMHNRIRTYGDVESGLIVVPIAD